VNAFHFSRKFPSELCSSDAATAVVTMLEALRTLLLQGSKRGGAQCAIPSRTRRARFCI
jgi:hypothetical protein